MTTASSALVGERRRRRWPWVVLVMGLLWTGVIRIPLILNAEDHLDSDLAVDGLTLIDALNGHWRWHYPGTPHMGILPVLSSYLQAMAWGASAVTLVSGGTVIWLLIVLATFVLAVNTFGSKVAAWAIIPLVFSTIGTIWLSGRITGGHLLTLFWHVVALAGVQAVLARGSPARVAALGLWCGAGVYLDAMFLVTLVAVIGAVIIGFGPSIMTKRIRAGAALFGVTCAIGMLPVELGRRFDPYDAYQSQFAATLDRGVIANHGRLILFHCLPRLLAGTELPALEQALRRENSRQMAYDRQHARRDSLGEIARLQEFFGVVLVAGFVIACARLGSEVLSRREPVRRGVSFATLASATLVTMAFLVNQSIFNSDNYRYLIYLLVPWSLGFGLLVNDLQRLRGWSRFARVLVVGLFAVVMTWQLLVWYRDTRRYVDEGGMPVRVTVVPFRELTFQADEPAADRFGPRRPWKYQIPTDVTHLFGGYWDVYRIAFLSGGRIVGVPLPMYPNRFQGWSGGLNAGNGKLLMFWPGDQPATAPRPASETRGDRIRMVKSAKRLDWRPAFTTVWELDGRDRADVNRLRVAVP